MLILYQISLRIHCNLVGVMVTISILMIQTLILSTVARFKRSTWSEISIYEHLQPAPSVGRTTLKPSEPRFNHLLLSHTHNKANCGLHHSKTAVCGLRGGARE